MQLFLLVIVERQQLMFYKGVFMNLLQPKINSFLKDNTIFILQIENNFYM